MTDQPGRYTPGWYATGDGWERWHDGTGWTEHARAVQTTYSPAPQGQPHQSGALAAPTYAHWGQRVGSYVVDMLLVLPFLVLGSVVKGFQGEAPDASQAPNVVGVSVLLAGGAVLLWNLVWRQGGTGYSLGKQVLGIRLVKDATLDVPGRARTFGRQVAHLVDRLLCYLGYLNPLWDSKRQTFADKICSTVVIEQPRS